MKIFGKKKTTKIDENPDALNPGPPTADSLALSPLSAVLPPFVVGRDGSFIYMLEMPPLEMGVGTDSFSIWAEKYQSALESLSTGTKFQMSIVMEPVDPQPDLQYFMNRVEEHAAKAVDPDSTDREIASGQALSLAAQSMMASLAEWFDQTRPVRMRTVIVLSYQHGVQVAKSAIFGNKATSNQGDLESKLPAAQEALSKKVSLLTSSFSNAGLPLRELSPGEMCQVFWRMMHPAASGDPRASATDLAISMASGNGKARMEPPNVEEFTANLSSSDLAGLLVPDTVIEQANYMEIDGVFVSGHVIHDFRPHKPAFMFRLSDLAGGWTGSMFVEVADPALTADALRQREVQLSATQHAKQSKGLVSDFSSQQENNTVQMSRMQLETMGKAPIYIRFFVMRTASSIKALNARNQDLESTLSTLGVRSFPARYSQSLLWKSILPDNRMHLTQKGRNMTPASLSTFYWPERYRVMDPDGIYMGIDEDTQLPIRLDPFGKHAEKTPTYLIIGRPGAGKSVYLRTEMTSALLAGGSVIALDLEGEMREYCERYGGRYIEVGSSSGERINILDIPPDADDALTAGTEHLVSFVEAVIGQRIPPGLEWNALAEAYRLTLEDRGWLKVEDNKNIVTEWNHEDAPRLSDITRVLQYQRNSAGADLAEMLRPYGEGLYAPYFNAQTTFDIRNERLVVFGLDSVNAHESSDRLRIYLWQVMGWIWGEILRRNSIDKAATNHVFLDEVWALLAAPGGAASIENMARRFRKRRAALWMATQEVGEFLESSAGQKILSIVGNTYLMGQRPMEARHIQKAFELSEGMAALLPRLQTGHGVLVTPNSAVRIWVAVPEDWKVF